MKKRFLCGSVIVIAFLLSSCKLTITSFDAPAAIGIGEVITLTINGEATKADKFATTFGIFLQLPDNWEVISAIAKLDGDASDYVLSHNTYDASLYNVPSGYKVWSGISPVEIINNFLKHPDGGKITVTMKVRTGGVVNIGCSLGQTYFLKVAAASGISDNKWFRDDPPEISDFSDITDDKHVKPIVIKDDSCLSATDPDLRLIFSCLKYQDKQYRLSLDYTPVSNDPSGIYWKYAVGSIALADNAQSDCISVSDAFKTLFTGK